MNLKWRLTVSPRSLKASPKIFEVKNETPIITLMGDSVFCSDP